MTPMTPKQKEVARLKAQRALLREKRRKARERKAAVRERRKAKRAVRMAPKHRLVGWSKRVRTCGKCAVCGQGVLKVKLDAHHILPKERYQELRFKTINGICLCFLHHKAGKFSAHRNPLWFALWLKANRPRQYEWAVANLGTDSTEQNGQGPQP